MPHYDNSDFPEETLVKVLDVDITLGTNDPFRAVVAGRFILSSKYLIHARTAGLDEDGFPMLDTGYVRLRDSICSFDLKQDRKTVTTKSLELRILPALWQSSSYYYTCLMLVRAADNGKQYRRIGHCSIPVGEFNAWILKCKVGHLKRLIEALDDDEIMTDENGEKYVIEMV